MQTQLRKEPLNSGLSQFKLSKLTLQNLSKFEISSTSKLVLLYLVDCYNPAKAYMFPKQETISERLGISTSSVKRAIKELSKTGIIVVEVKFTNRYSLTPEFFNVVKMSHDMVQNEKVTVQNEPYHVTEKEPYKKQKTDASFSYKSLIELQRTNTISYFESIQRLSATDKEHLLKIKLGRMNLTEWQKTNIDKLIMLSDSEISIINSKEPYHRLENVNIFYSERMRKIREVKQEQPHKNQVISTKSERDSTLALLACGYKVNSTNKLQLADYLKRNREKMELFNITESELSC